MKLALLLTFSLASFGFSDLLQLFTRDTNADAAAKRGAAQYGKKHYDQALQSFRKARSLHPTSRSGFNVATTEIAAGQLEQGSTDMTAALRDPELRADALYNRGNSALSAKSYDAAIRDYIDSLRIRPSSIPAKRNLEIALDRKAQQQKQENEKQQQDRGGQGGQQPASGKQKPAPGTTPTQAPLPQQGQQKADRVDVDSLLRSIQQQENEELSRMRKARPEPRKIGW
jgi:Ca-activated chloride channel family protein